MEKLYENGSKGALWVVVSREKGEAEDMTKRRMTGDKCDCDGNQRGW